MKVKIKYTDKDFELDEKSKNEKVNIPEGLTAEIHQGMVKYVSPNLYFTSFKYSVVFIFCGLISLFLCPQKGFGFLKSYPLFFHFLHTNLFICGLYCGAFFALTTHFISMLLMTHFERIHIFSSLRFLPHFWFGLFFVVFMYIGDDFYRLNVNYNLAWIFVVLIPLTLTNRRQILKTL